jgi:hypothetical protein
MEVISIDDQPLKFECTENFKYLNIFEYESVHPYMTFSALKRLIKTSEYQK